MNNFNQVKDLYKSILNINLQIAEFIEKKDYNEMVLCINKKNECIEKVNFLKHNSQFSEEEQAYINTIMAEIKDIDTKNINVMEQERDAIKKELMSVSKKQKVLSTYSIPTSNAPSLFDVKE